MVVAAQRIRSTLLDWRSLLTGLLCIGAFVAAVLLTADAAIGRYGWGAGLLIAWLTGPAIGGAAALVVFLWLLPLQPASPAPAGHASPGDSAEGSGRPVSISVVMTVFNAKPLLQRSLPPLGAMLKRGEVLELIVVDEGSTDGSVEVAAAQGASVLRTAGRLGPSTARNLAAQRARGAVLWFIDPDVAVHPDGPCRIRCAFSDEQVVALSGAHDPRPAERNFGSRYATLLLRHQQAGAPGDAPRFWSGCGAVSRKAFLGAGGFDPTRQAQPSAEDFDLQFHLGASAGRIVGDRNFLGRSLRRWSVAEVIRAGLLQDARPSRPTADGSQPAAAPGIAVSERLRAGLAVATLASVALALAALAPVWLPLLLFLSAVTTNWRLFQTFHRYGGAAFAVLAMAFQQVRYVYAACALGLAWTAKRLPPRYARARQAGRGATDRSAIA